MESVGSHWGQQHMASCIVGTMYNDVLSLPRTYAPTQYNPTSGCLGYRLKPVSSDLTEVKSPVATSHDGSRNAQLGSCVDIRTVWCNLREVVYEFACMNSSGIDNPSCETSGYTHAMHVMVATSVRVSEQWAAAAVSARRMWQRAALAACRAV